MTSPQPDPFQAYPEQGSPQGQTPQAPYPYPQQPYPAYAPGYAPMAPVAPTNTMAILAIVFAFVFAPLAIVFGHIARKQIRATGEQGSGLATAGLICGYVFTGLQVLLCVGYLAFFAYIFSNRA